MLHLLLGRAKTGKTTELFRRIAANGPQRPQVLLVPEQYSHETERRLCRAGGNRTAGFCEVLSFTRLANRVFTKGGGLAEPVLDGGGRLLLMHEAVQATAGTLSVYAKPSRKAAFLEGLLSTADELKSCCVQPDDLLAAGREEEGDAVARLHDLGLILGAYEGLVAQRAADPRDRLTRAAERISACGYGAGWDFYVDSFTDFTPQELLVLEQLLGQAASVTVALTCDTLAQEGAEPRAFARKTALRLLDLAKTRNLPADCQTLTGRKDGCPPALALLEEGLFDRNQSAAQVPPEGVRLLTAADPYAEVEAAAGEIRRLVREEGLHYREIAVSARTMEDYGDLIETIFQRYEIPVFLGQREDILQKPIMTLLTAALDAVGGRYEYDDLFRYLKTGLAGVPLEEVDLLENYALRWNLRGSQWTRETPWNWHPEGYGRKWTDEDRELVERLDRLRRDIIAPLERLRQTPKGPGGELVQALYGFLEDIQLPQRLTERAEALRERGDLQQAEEYRQLWDILCGAMEQCAQLMGGDPMTMEEFADLFQLVLSQYDVGTIPVSLDRVAAGEMGRLAHRETKVLFLLGMDDDHLPLVTQNPSLLTDEDRLLLSSRGCELAPDADERLDRENVLACDGVCIPSERLYLSWAERGTGGGECRPAYLIRRLRQLFPALEVEEPDKNLRYGAALPALDEAARGGSPAVFAVLGEDPAWAGRTRAMREATSLRRGSLSRESTDALYGKKVRLSASKMDTMKSCHFSYFMQYGLQAKARKPAGFDPPQVGTFVHYVLEHVLREAQKQGGVKQLDTEEIRKLTRQAVERYIREELGELEEQTPRFRCLFRRLTKSVDLIVENVADELRHSEFQPISFELGFGREKDLPPVELKTEGVTLSISGFVDRVDGWVYGDKLYLRVVDYKTGKKSFSLTDVWHGLEMQMLLYLFTLEDEGKALYGKDIVASGVLYLPARDLILPGSHGMTEEQRRKALDTALSRSGMLLDDSQVLHAMEDVPLGESPRFLPIKVAKRTGAISGENLATAAQWGKLHHHVGEILREIAHEISAGDISADPYLRADGRSPCDYCDYPQACHFEEGQGGDCRRFLYKVQGKDFWEKEKGE
ncbi:MAG: PD-(D/E)XK nuclease family protein [Clostridiales bacterium]|nr:PD-(D/E)XK nuclease family protein [Clostridiales bacterium]